MTRACVCLAVLLPGATTAVSGGPEPRIGDTAASQPAPRDPTTQPATTQPAQPVADDMTDIAPQNAGVAAVPKDASNREIIDSAAIGAQREPDPAGYLRPLAAHAGQFGRQGLESFHWFDVGIEQRTRFELRDDHYRADQESGNVFFMRNRAYVGVREILDPLRFGMEFQDSRRFGDDLVDRSNIDEADVLQLFGELYVHDAAVEGYPLRFRVGRMSFDSIDRRLVARNRFRNSTTAFDGFRLTLGEQTTDWEIDFFAAMPVECRPLSLDPSDEEAWFYGLTAYWRGWSPHVNLSLFYFILDRDAKDPDDADEEIHTIGVHGFGLIGATGFDYDFDTAFQFGDDGDLTRRAFAMHAEIGYTFTHPYRARVAGWINYASGDRDPNDGVNQRFNRLYGASHTMYGYSDLFIWENMINPTAYCSFAPTTDARLEAFYRAYWLASSTDGWAVPGLRDPTGAAGSFIGQEIDLRASYKMGRHLAIQVGYAHFVPGTFVTRTAQPADDSDSLYVQLTLRL